MSKNYKTQITVVIIAVVGFIAAALISGCDKTVTPPTDQQVSSSAPVEVAPPAKSLTPEEKEVLKYINRGLAFMEQNKNDEAEKAFLEALRLDPKNYDVHRRLGFLYSEMGRGQEAVKMFSKARRIREASKKEQ